MPEALAHWLEKQEKQEIISSAADRATDIEEIVEQLNRLGRDEEQTLNRIDAGQQPTLVTRGVGTTFLKPNNSRREKVFYGCPTEISNCLCRK